MPRNQPSQVMLSILGVCVTIALSISVIIFNGWISDKLQKLMFVKSKSMIDTTNNQTAGKMEKSLTRWSHMQKSVGATSSTKSPIQ